MVPWQSQRPIGGIRILCDLAQEQGVPLDVCLQETGLEPGALSSGRARISTDQEFTVIRNVLAALGSDEHWGLQVGLRYHPTTFAVWGFAVLSSLTARQAVEVGIRYMKLTGALWQAYIEDIGDESHLVFDSSGLPADLERFIVERDLAAMLSMQRDVVPVHIPLRRLEFQFAEPASVAAYETLFQLRPAFGQAITRIVVDAELGNLPLPQGNRSALRYCEQQCQQLLNEKNKREGVSGQLRELLVTQSRAMPTMPAAAKAINLSIRSLRRRLLEEGTDYESLVTEVRRSLAEELLNNGVLNVAQVAERLGYAEVASFSRAFKRWTGVAPSKFRDHGTAG